MKADPIINEIRQTRGRLLAESNADLDRLLDRYKQSEDRDRVVTLGDVERRRQQHQPAPLPQPALPRLAEPQPDD
ncbi:MAG: hypothetical protein U1E05_12530 [Patescibacteria group bacterium]|nr:hypothetical protein [Patescibacteria group bacterium]